MTRMRTHRRRDYFVISNSTAQDENISFAALGLLTYCLSMPEDWEFNPKVIWKSRDLGRDSTYNCFNELITNYKCIRVRKPNPKAKNLPGEIEYEIFDDSDDCKKRIKQLLDDKENFVEYAENLKKYFRHPVSQDPEPWDPEKQNTTKETSLHTKETTQQQSGGGSSSESEKLKELAKLPLNTKTIEKALLYSIDDIKLAIECCLNPAKPIDNVDGYLMSALKEKWQPKPNKAKFEAIKEETQQQQLLARQKVCLEAKQLEVTHKYNLKETASFSVNENTISLKIDNGFSPLEMTEQSLKILKKYIKDNQKNVH